ncbi:MAG: hypothetical protein H5U06_04170 [Candidatus Aminicenantes bacterium]|nr:hypothetical protein [Candidatus Aminicenantes bacterium]
MKNVKAIIILALIVAIGFISFLPKEVQASDPVKKLPGWWINNYCVCPIIWMSDCDCIIKQQN